METIEVYSKCKGILDDIQRLFNYYEKYYHCVAISCLDSEMNDIIRNLNLAYAHLMVKVDKDIAVSNLVIVRNDDDIESIVDKNPLYIHQIIDLMEKYSDGIVAMLNTTTPQRRSHHLASFEACFNDSRRFINRMEMMIRNSQVIRHSYLRAIA